MLCTHSEELWELEMSFLWTPDFIRMDFIGILFGRARIFLLSGLVEMAFAYSHTGQRVSDLITFWMLTSHGLG